MRNLIFRRNRAHPGRTGESSGVWGGRRASPSRAERDGLQVAKDRGEDPGPGIGFRHRDPDVADGQTDWRADHE